MPRKAVDRAGITEDVRAAYEIVNEAIPVRELPGLADIRTEAFRQVLEQLLERGRG